MSAGTAIEWTQRTWNPIVGCSIHTPGCTNCYAMKMAGRLEAMSRAGQSGMDHYVGTTRREKAGFVWTGRVNRAPEHIRFQPLEWKKPALIFVNSMSDLFHQDVPDEWIDEIFAIMALCPQHTFQVLTKRADRMREYLRERIDARGNQRAYTVWDATLRLRPNDFHAPKGDFVMSWDDWATRYNEAWKGHEPGDYPWPLPNVWLGVTVEDQKRADERIPDLIASPAAIRWLSMEPLLGPVDLTAIPFAPPQPDDKIIPTLNALEVHPLLSAYGIGSTKIDWIVVGGESGQGARPMHPDWARRIRDDCEAFGVPFFFKQWGEWAQGSGTREQRWVCPDGQSSKAILPIPHRDACRVTRFGKKLAGRELDGCSHDDYPEITHG